MGNKGPGCLKNCAIRRKKTLSVVCVYFLPSSIRNRPWFSPLISLSPPRRDAYIFTVAGLEHVFFLPTPAPHQKPGCILLFLSVVSLLKIKIRKPMSICSIGKLGNQKDVRSQLFLRRKPPLDLTHSQKLRATARGEPFSLPSFYFWNIHIRVV